MPNNFKVLFVASEALPFASTGGLADVLGSLPAALVKKGVDVRVVIPYYGTIKNKFKDISYVCDYNVKLAWRNQYCGVHTTVYNGVTFYFIDNEYYFNRASLYGSFDDGERYAFFSKAVLDMLPRVDFFPDVIHTNDWQAALVGIYLKQIYRRDNYNYRPIRVIHSIHNIEYQGVYDPLILGDVFDLAPEYASIVDYNGAINLTKGAIVCCDRLTTVSPTYAKEICTPEYSAGLHNIINQYGFKTTGIINGIDMDYYNPMKDPDLYAKYRSLTGKEKNKLALQKELGLPERSDVPVVSMITRLTSHKGLDLVTRVIDEFLCDDVQFVVLGTGDPGFESFFKRLEEAHPDKVKAIIAYDKALSKKIYGGSDIFLMPSKSEPCGLAQMIASRYGAVPVVRETGGLYDTIKYYNDETGEGNGFTFKDYNANDMLYTLRKAEGLFRDYKDKWKELSGKIMKIDFSWNVSAKAYIFFNGICIQKIVLQGHAEHRVKLTLRDCSDISTAYSDSSLVHVIKSHKQTDKRGLSASCCTYYSERRSAFKRE